MAGRQAGGVRPYEAVGVGFCEHLVPFIRGWRLICETNGARQHGARVAGRLGSDGRGKRAKLMKAGRRFRKKRRESRAKRGEHTPIYRRADVRLWASMSEARIQDP